MSEIPCVRCVRARCVTLRASERAQRLELPSKRASSERQREKGASERAKTCLGACLRDVSVCVKVGVCVSPVCVCVCALVQKTLSTLLGRLACNVVERQLQGPWTYMRHHVLGTLCACEKVHRWPCRRCNIQADAETADACSSEQTGNSRSRTLRKACLCDNCRMILLKPTLFGGGVQFYGQTIL